MRLLERDDAGEIRLTENFLDGSKIPQYAILSHTWGSEEVLFNDLTDGTGKNKLGYEKIRFCGEQARRDGYRHFWVDTCCIDKTSSAELQENISCMFRFYRDAEKCYVYLADVSRLPPEADGESSRSRWKPAFRKSRWFTRGWTLQELIAPASVEFFSKEGIRLGTKMSLRETIYDITGIPLGVLQGSPLSDISISQRMEWVEKRETTRKEDKAYSLLGIFDVHMPLLYGEGRERAFLRLQEEIDKSSKRIDKARSNTCNGGFSMGFKLPGVARVHHFVAREEELNQLHEILSKGPDRRTAVIHGLGGMGKTQVAVEYAQRHRNDYSAVLWFNARDQASLKQEFLRTAERILHEFPSVVYIQDAVESRDLDEAVRAVKRWLDISENDGWLLIYDNYDNPVLNKGDEKRKKNELDTAGDGVLEGYDMRTFLPDAYHGAVLITTRSSRIQFGHRVPLKKLKHVEESLAILCHTSGRQNLGKDPSALELAQKLDGLPLALSTAGVYLCNMPTTCAEYIQLYDKSWQRLQLTTPSLDSYDKSLYSTWDISYTQVRLRNATSAMLLQLWAYFDHEDLWFELLREGQLQGPPWFQKMTDDIIEFNTAVRVLCDYGLVEADISSKEYATESHGYSIHSCVHAWTVHVLNEAKDKTSARLAITCVSSKVPAMTEHEYWVIQQRLIQHGAYCSTMIMDSISLVEGEEWTLQKLGDLFKDQGLLDKAEAMYDRALQAREKTLGPDHTSTLQAVHNLGKLYLDKGRLDEAEAVYNRALKGREKALGPDHTSTLGTVNNLGLVYRDQGRLNEAEAMYDRALQGIEKALGPDHPSTLAVVNNLGILYRNQGRLGEAEAMYNRALQNREKVLGPDHTATLATVNNLGLVYWDQGRLDKAEAMFNRALQGIEVLGPDHARTLDTVHNLGLVYLYQGRLNEAEAMNDRALKGREKVLGPDNLSTLDTLNNLGTVYKDQGRLDEAEAMYHRSLKGREKALGPDHLSTLETVNNLGTLFWNHGRPNEAEAMYDRALQGYQKMSTPQRANINVQALDNVEDFAKFCIQQGKICQARTLYTQYQASFQAVFGVEHARYKRVTQELESLSLS
ncbi:hypothetical protein B0T14DRAFT_488834 [Immersiella caudata]|uniref:Heterokaryon incompatibility domain-containing protein n=1 Tax=Immersiella caudata TaxID=314043 RepID=A0AA39TSZ9_9PEZI|nr:hypothetical protein B0T14DRAFT_488834 [Immersiella caudata]